MKKPKNKEYRSFQLMLALCVFFILCITILIFGTVVMIYEQTDLLSLFDSSVLLLLAFSAIASIAIGTALTPLILRLPLKPIARLIAAMKRLAGGHFEERVDLGSLAMLKELSENFNALAGELEHTEILRSDFVNHFSHEFKTPIVSIRGFARLLKSENLPEEKRKQYLTIIEDESTRLAAMATNVLNMTKVENQKILADVKKFNVSEQLRKCILLFEKKWMEKKLEIDSDFSEYFLQGNLELLDQVWVNLLDNAVKFSPPGGRIRVSVFPKADIEGGGKYLKIVIANQGPMIPREQQKRIFEKFYQGDTSHSSEGAGVGLSVAKRIVELHRGRIEVESREGETAFSVILPREN